MDGAWRGLCARPQIKRPRDANIWRAWAAGAWELAPALPSETARCWPCTKSGAGRVAFPWHPLGEALLVACSQAWKLSLYWTCYNIASILFWFFGPKAFGILAPWSGIEPAPPTLEGKVLTTGLPRKSHIQVFNQEQDSPVTKINSNKTKICNLSRYKMENY